MMRLLFKFWLIVGLYAALCLNVYADQDVTFPRLMGMNIGAKNYEDEEYQKNLARLDIVILGFYRGWNPEKRPDAIREVVRKLKSLNPSILVGQYTVLNEAYDDPEDAASLDIRDKITWHQWWLKDGKGKKTQWTTKYNAYEVNFTEWAHPDTNGNRYSQWRAERDYQVFFRPAPEFDIWYADNVMARPRVKADWDGDGVDDDPDEPRILDAWRQGYKTHWDHIRSLAPKIMIMGNTDGDLSQTEFQGQLDGAFLESLIGNSWSIEKRLGWDKMMERYRSVLRNTREPHLVGFGVTGEVNDYRLFRYAFASCLMDNGYFSFDIKNNGSSDVPWFDEYDFKLGKAVSPPQSKPWKGMVYRRDFEHGIVLVNPGQVLAKVVIETGFKYLNGTQAPLVNTGQLVKEVLIQPRDGLVLAREQ